MTTAVIIGNPNSGSAGDENYLEGFAATLRAGGLTVEVLNTEHPDHATELAAAAGDRLVIAAGGDGTVNEVINGLSEDATLGILPLGTANVLARELGLPLEPGEACGRILSGKAFRIDIGVATDGGETERRFACMAGIGFDAEVVREVGPRLKRYLRSLAFPLAALKVYIRGDRPGLRIADAETTRPARFAVVANGRYYGGEFETAEEASLTSGELQVVLVEKVGSLARPDVLAHILAKRSLDRTMKSFASRDVSAESASAVRVPVQIDGEVWGELPMSFRVEPAAVSVIR
ncbi:MAG: Diacylglycerol kinase-related protein [uncultured Rubrobacteraceae bacterium]|uniref:Diacylglycerol kinase-related protein n=1 Tax=uncultured Rubrobacteraceae bacterium TaxID=349277 RepID=A0A6J4NXQ9_9ACTN|nr:MAG: Diacylglycerol kinase-related protein [uncultured Rubrobacteraceae bacterium]